eukprot:2190906-Pleurochrysis_carterae.AAC.1
MSKCCTRSLLCARQGITRPSMTNSGLDVDREQIMIYIFTLLRAYIKIVGYFSGYFGTEAVIRGLYGKLSSNFYAPYKWKPALRASTGR